jgi:hypothetical protein
LYLNPFRVLYLNPFRVDILKAESHARGGPGYLRRLKTFGMTLRYIRLKALRYLSAVLGTGRHPDD